MSGVWPSRYWEGAYDQLLHNLVRGFKYYDYQQWIY